MVCLAIPHGLDLGLTNYLIADYSFALKKVRESRIDFDKNVKDKILADIASKRSERIL